MEKQTCRRILSASPDGRISHLIAEELYAMLDECFAEASHPGNIAVAAKRLLTMAADCRHNGYDMSALTCYRRAIDLLSDGVGMPVHRRLRPLLIRAWGEYHELLDTVGHKHRR